jgi:hypothetical protein
MVTDWKTTDSGRIFRGWRQLFNAIAAPSTDALKRSSWHRIQVTRSARSAGLRWSRGGKAPTSHHMNLLNVRRQKVGMTSHRPRDPTGLLTGKRTVQGAYSGMSESSGHRSCKCGAVYDRSEHIAEAREISSFECAVCGATIENWNSAWVPRYRFIACPATDAK